MLISKIVKNIPSKVLVNETKKAVLIYRRNFSNITERASWENSYLLNLDRLTNKNKGTTKIQVEGISTSAINLSGNDCVEKGKTSCHITETAIPCRMVPLEKWKVPCDRICVPCCRAINVPAECFQRKTLMNVCKTIDYKYASFAERVKGVVSEKKCDCCTEVLCPVIFASDAFNKKSILKSTQRLKLGLPTDSRRFFATNAECDPGASKKDEEKKGSDSSLPCIKKVESYGSKKQMVATDECKKACMPCCKPARDPPDCTFPYVKPKCVKYRPPRPAYSECQTERMPQPEPCECPLPVLRRCVQTSTGSEKKQKGKCAK